MALFRQHHSVSSACLSERTVTVRTLCMLKVHFDVWGSIMFEAIPLRHIKLRLRCYGAVRDLTSSTSAFYFIQGRNRIAEGRSSGVTGVWFYSLRKMSTLDFFYNLLRSAENFSFLKILIVNAPCFEMIPINQIINIYETLHVNSR